MFWGWSSKKSQLQIVSSLNNLPVKVSREVFRLNEEKTLKLFDFLVPKFVEIDFHGYLYFAYADDQSNFFKQIMERAKGKHFKILNIFQFFS